jgi:hypothetical protein
MTFRRTRQTAVVAAVAAAAAAGGAIAASHGNAIVLSDKQAVTHGGITCTAYRDNGAKDANLVCIRNNLRGYGVIVSATQIVVAKELKQGKIRIVFQRANR